LQWEKTLEGAPSKLRLGGVFSGIHHERDFAYASVFVKLDCQY